MQDDTEWGPWIEHDGSGCPCKGFIVEGVDRSGLVEIWIAGTVLLDGGGGPDAWSWFGLEPSPVDVIRYRIRKPRALLDMIERSRKLDNAPEGPRVKTKVTA